MRTVLLSLRLLVATLHVLLGLGMASVVALLGGLVALARIWEQGFYGEISELTGAFTVGLALSGLLAAAELVGAVAFAGQRRWGGSLLLGIAVLLWFMGPAPLRLVGLITVGTILAERWQRLRERAAARAAG